MDFLKEKPEQKPPLSKLALIKFETYEDYLDSLYSDRDRCYLGDRHTCRKIAEFGYTRDGVTLSRQEFTKTRNKILAYLTPIQPSLVAKREFKLVDPAQIALAIRERPNRVGLLATIIFINCTTKGGREISGYIDYAHSLLVKDWTNFFQKNQPMYPDKSDLGFYDWKKDSPVLNNTLNFKTLMSPERGLMFQHKFDRKLITSDPFNSAREGKQTTRVRIKSKLYNSFVLLDHVLRVRK